MFWRSLWLAVLLVVSWCVMVIAHESGHLVGGLLGGGTLREAELRPWRMPYSRFDPDPRPLLTLWSGPLLGVLLPLGVAMLIRGPSMRFIAGFCLLANGVYLVAAWISEARWLDTTRLLEAGAHPATIAAYCVVTIGVGYPMLRSGLVVLLSETKR